jgi:hypothetical protein
MVAFKPKPSESYKQERLRPLFVVHDGRQDARYVFGYTRNGVIFMSFPDSSNTTESR